MPPDIEKYRQYVDRFDLSEERKIELIHIVWRMMESFVDRAFGTDPVQLARKEAAASDSKPRGDRVNLQRDSIRKLFSETAAASASGEGFEDDER